MNMGTPAAFIAALAMSIGFSALLVNFLFRHARRIGMLALPGARQSHAEPTPTGTGAGMVAALAMSSVIMAQFFPLSGSWQHYVLPATVVLSAVGWLDDRFSLSRLLRLAIQLLVSLGLLVLLSSGPNDPPWWFWPLGAMAIVWVMNAYNFMDGSHGMAGFQGVFAGLVLCLLFLDAGEPGLALPALLLSGVCLGFLPVNFPVARAFMGDAGSVPLGFALAALISLGINLGALPLSIGLMVLVLFLVDSSLTLLSRVFRGERWYTPHKQHMYQRLIDLGWSHSRVLLLYQAINLLVVAPVIILARTYPDLACVLAGGMFLLLTTGWYLASLRLGVRN